LKKRDEPSLLWGQREEHFNYLYGERTPPAKNVDSRKETLALPREAEI